VARSRPSIAPRRGGGLVHRGLVSLLREDPGWLVDVLIALGEVPAGCAIEQLPTEAYPFDPEGRQRELRADLVLRLWPNEVPRVATLKLLRAIRPLGVVLEAQCSIDDDRIHRWCEFALVYLPTFGSEPLLVILALDPIVVRWIESILDQVRKKVRVVLLVPGTIPRISSVDPHERATEDLTFGPPANQATPHRVLLDAMIHVRGESELPLLVDAFRALQAFEGGTRLMYLQMLHSQLEERLIMRAYERWVESDGVEDEGPPDYQGPDWVAYEKDYDDPTYELSEAELKSFLYMQGWRAGTREGQAGGREEGRQEGREEGRQEGRREGRAEAVVALLRARQLSPSDALVERIGEFVAHRPLERLDHLLLRAATITDLDELEAELGE
jgi:hypothetical protein